MNEEEILKKAEYLLHEYSNLKEKVLDKGIDNRDRKSAAFKLREIHNALSILTTDEALLIKRRYFENMSWYAINKAIGYKNVGNTSTIKNRCNKIFRRIVPLLLPYEYILLGGDDVFNRFS